MVANDFNNGLIMGLSLQGVIFKGVLGQSVPITSIESSGTILRVKYDNSTEFIEFIFYEEAGTGIFTYFHTPNGVLIKLTPIANEEIIYKEVEE